MEYPEQTSDTEVGNDLNFLTNVFLNVYLSKARGVPIEDNYIITEEDYKLIEDYIQRQKAIIMKMQVES